MPNGRDGKIVSKYTPNHFLLTPEMQKTTEVNSWNTPVPKDKQDLVPTYNDEPPASVIAGLEEGLRHILPQRKAAVEERFGKGSADWIINNLSQFTSEEKYRLHDMFFQMKPNPINSDPASNTGHMQIRTMSPIIGRRG